MKKVFKFLLITLMLTTLGFLVIQPSFAISGMSDQEMVIRDTELVTVPTSAIASFPVATSSVFGSQITWSSNNETVMTFMDGWFVVNRLVDEDATVTVTVTISKNEATSTKDFVVLVPKGITNTKTFIINYFNVESAENYKSSYQLGEASFLLPVPEKLGYSFLGWYQTDNFEPSSKLEKVLVGTRTDINLYAKWTEANVEYKVLHHLESLDDELVFDLVATDKLTALTNAIVTADSNDYPGFRLKENLPSGTVLADGSLVLDVYYERVEYTISIDANGGTEVQDIKAKYGKPITAPELTRNGYEFVGWEGLVSFPTTMPSQDLTVKALWTPKQVNYKVEHYHQNIDNDNYTLFETNQDLTALTDATVTVNANIYEGFTANQPQVNGTVLADGTLVLKLYYTRNSYTISFDANGGTINPTSITARFGTSITEPTKSRVGYEFTGWDKAFPSTMPSSDLTLVATWQVVEVDYTVKTRFEDLEGGYVESTVTYQALTDTSITLEAALVDGFTLNSELSVLEGTVTGDGLLVLTVYYTRNSYAIIFNVDGGIQIDNLVAKFEAPITPPTTTKTGYNLEGWEAFPTTMPLNGLIVKAIWAPVSVEYKVLHFGENLDKSYSPLSTDNLTALTNSSVTAALKPFEGFTFDESHAGNILTGTVLADGTLVLEMYYSRNSYTITINLNGGEGLTSVSAKHGATVSAPTVTRTNYSFVGWEPEFPATMPIGGMTVTAQWTELPTYEVFFNVDGGSYITTQNIVQGNKVVKPDNPTKTGYTFDNWYLEGLENIFDFDTPITEGLTLFAKWNKALVNYQVQYYHENANDSGYTLNLTDTLTEFTGTLVSAVVKTYEGFTHDEGSSLLTGTVQADGSLVLKVYYTRNLYTITIDENGGNDVSDIVLKYEAGVNEPTMTKAGYDFTSWDKDFPETMPLNGLEITALWTAKEVAYKVEHYQQNIENNDYTLFEVLNLTAYTDSEVNASAKTYLGFTANQPQVSGTVLADGTLVLKLYYTRNSYTISFNANGGTINPSSINARFGSTITEPTKSKVGYEFKEWDQEFPTTMPSSVLTLIAIWEAIRVDYVVQHYFEDLSGNYIIDSDKTENKVGYSDTTINATILTVTGFSENITHENRLVNSTILPNGSLVLRVYYERGTYTISIDADGGTSDPTSITTKYGYSILEPITSKQGYEPDGWVGYDEFPITMPSTNVTIKALWKAVNVNYTIEYYLENVDGSYSMNKEIKQDLTDSQVSITAPEVEHFVFDKTNPSNKLTGTVLANGTLVLKVYYQRIAYKVTFDNDGYSFEPMYVKHGQAILIEAIPTRTGYDFVSWIGKPEVMPTEDIVISASWSMISYTISYQFIFNSTAYEGIVTNENPTSFKIIDSLTLVSFTVVDTDYTFGGWFQDSSLTTPTTGFDENTTGNKVYYGKIVYSPSKALALDKQALIAEYESILTGYITSLSDLRVLGINGTVITWQSSNTAVSVNHETGKVTITQSYTEDIFITLTAILTQSGTESDNVQFEFTVPKLILPLYSDDFENHAVIAYTDTSTKIAGLDWNIKQVYLSLTGDSSDRYSATNENKRMLRLKGSEVAHIELSTYLTSVSKITFDAKYYSSSHSGSVMKVSKQVSGGAWVVVETVTLTDSYQTFTVNINEYNVKIRIDVTKSTANIDNIKIYDIIQTDEQKVAQDKATIEALSGDINQGDIFNLITTGLKGSNITWAASPSNLIDENGVVGAVLLESGTLTLTATLTLNKVTTTATVTLNIIVIPEVEKISSDLAEIPNDFGDRRTSFVLPSSFTHRSLVVWTVKNGSSITIVNNEITQFIRPSEVDEVVTLTATLTLGKESISKDVTVKVLKEVNITEELIYSTGFESTEGFVAGTTYNNSTPKVTGQTGKQWSFYYGTPSTTDPITGAQSAQMRWYSGDQSNNHGYALMNFNLHSVTKVVFDALNTDDHNVKVFYSTDNGSTWQGEELFTLSTSSETYTYIISETGQYQNVRVKFELSPGEKHGSRITIDNVKIYAASYTVSFEGNGADSGSINPVTFVGTPITLPTTGFVKSGYKLLGWDTNSNAATPTHLPGTSFTTNENTTLYAIWEEVNEYVISFDANGGIGSVSPMTYVGTPLTLPSIEFTREGYTLLGWDTENNALNATYQPGGQFNPTSSLTLYAIWEEDGVETGAPLPYTINFDTLSNNTYSSTWLKYQLYSGFSQIGNMGQSYAGYAGFGRSGDSTSTLVTPELDIRKAFEVSLNVKGNATDNLSYFEVYAYDSKNNLVATAIVKSDTGGGSTIGTTKGLLKNNADTNVVMEFTQETLESGKKFEDIYELRITYYKKTGNMGLKNFTVSHKI